VVILVIVVLNAAIGACRLACDRGLARPAAARAAGPPCCAPAQFGRCRRRTVPGDIVLLEAATGARRPAADQIGSLKRDDRH